MSFGFGFGFGFGFDLKGAHVLVNDPFVDTTPTLAWLRWAARRFDYAWLRIELLSDMG